MGGRRDAREALPHGPLTRLSDSLWRLDGSLSRVTLRRAMTVARLRGGGLVLHRAVAVDEPTPAQVLQLGPLRALPVPAGTTERTRSRPSTRSPRSACPRRAARAVGSSRWSRVRAPPTTSRGTGDARLERLAGTATSLA